MKVSKERNSFLLVAILITFFFSLATNLLTLSWGKLPVLYNDSGGYLDVAQSIATFHWPTLTLRTPVYPLFLSPFVALSHVRLAIYLQVVVGAFSSVILFLIAHKLVKNIWAAFFAALLASLNFQVINFQSTLLTETVSFFLVYIFAYFHLLFFSDPTRSQLLPLMLVSDGLLMLVRPSYLFLPLITYLVLLCLVNWIYSSNRKVALRHVSIGLGSSLVIIAILCGYNYFRSGFLGVSEVSDINTFGKVVQYRLIERNNLRNQNPQPLYSPVLEKYFQDTNKQDPYPIFEPLFVSLGREQTLELMGQLNKDALKGNKVEYMRQTARVIPQALSARFYYAEPTTVWGNKTLQFIGGIRGIADSRTVLFISVFAILLSLYLAIRSKVKLYAIGIMFLVGIVLYILLINSLFSYMEYARMLAPIWPLVDVLKVISLVFLLLHYWPVKLKVSLSKNKVSTKMKPCI